MSNLNLSIGGRTFAVACADGEEDHVLTLGRIIDAKAQQSGQASQSESRMLLFAALLLADENHELSSRSGNGDAIAGAPSPERDERLVRLAERLEKLADLLESDEPNA